MLSKDKLILWLKMPFLIFLKIQLISLFSFLFISALAYFFDLSFVIKDDRYGVSYVYERIWILQIIVTYAYTYRFRFMNQLRILGFVFLYFELCNIIFRREFYFIDSVVSILIILGLNYFLGRK